MSRSRLGHALGNVLYHTQIEKQRNILRSLLHSLGYSNSTIKQSLDSIRKECIALVNANRDSMNELPIIQNKLKLKFELILLNKMCQNLNIIKENSEYLEAFNEIAECMKIKSGNESCQAALKLLLFLDKPQRIVDFKESRDTLITITEKESVNKIFGYILSLNFNMYNYMQLSIIAAQSNTEHVHSVAKHHRSYQYLIELDKRSAKDPTASITRRNLLYKTGLLSGHLQRDPEEQRLYDAQMLSARTDKAKLLIDINNKVPLLLVDIGPAGGATFNEVMELSSNKEGVTYCGVEFDEQELKTLQRMQIEKQERSHELNRTGLEALHRAQFIKGNALDLMKVIHQFKQTAAHCKNNFIAIVLSSVIHEIYSYCPYNPEPQDDNLHQSDFLKKTPKITETSEKHSYNQKTIAKVYREALLTLKNNPEGGTINIRDGVMYHNPDEPVTFTIMSESWANMLNVFLKDSKYSHLNQLITKHPISQNDTITLPAKYVQEFMIKANWGPDSFGNEINEVYCYMRREDHVELIHRLAKDLGMDVKISSEEYTQDGYKKHITHKDIIIENGFGNDKFPSTNMVVRVEFTPALELISTPTSSNKC